MIYRSFHAGLMGTSALLVLVGSPVVASAQPDDAWPGEWVDQWLCEIEVSEDESLARALDEVFEDVVDATEDVDAVIEAALHAAQSSRPVTFAPDGVQSTLSAVTTTLSVFDSSVKTTVSVSPLRLFDDAWLRGFTAGITYDSTDQAAGFQVAFRLDPRWTLEGLLEESLEDVDALTEATTTGNGLARAAERLDEAARMLTLDQEDVANAVVALDRANRAIDAVGDQAVSDRRDATSTRRAAREAVARGLEELGRLLDSLCRSDGAVLVDESLPEERLVAARAALRSARDAVERHTLRVPGQAPEEDAGGLMGDDQLVAEIQRALDNELAFLLPSVTLRYSEDYFFLGAEVDRGGQEVVRSRALDVRSDWYFQQRVELNGGYQIRWGRGSSVDDGDTGVDDRRMATTHRGDGTLLVLFPELVGTTPYDDHFFEEGFQRGVGFGFQYSHTLCERSGDEVALCPKQRRRDEWIGGVADVRLSKLIRPRLTVGRRQATVVGGVEQRGFEVSAVLAITVDATP